MEKRQAEGKRDVQGGGAGAGRQETQTKCRKQAWKAPQVMTVERQVGGSG